MNIADKVRAVVDADRASAFEAKMMEELNRRPREVARTDWYSTATTELRAIVNYHPDTGGHSYFIDDGVDRDEDEYAGSDGPIASRRDALQAAQRDISARITEVAEDEMRLEDRQITEYCREHPEPPAEGEDDEAPAPRLGM